MKKKIYLIIAIVVLLIIIGIIFLSLRGDEDNWIKDAKGIFIKHGNSSEVPDYVASQQEAIICALNLYNQEKSKGIEFNSQCLGKCSDYSVDIVHVPRSEDDNKAENQCADFRNGITRHFIELDKDSGIVNIQ